MSDIKNNQKLIKMVTCGERKHEETGMKGRPLKYCVL